MKWPCRTIAAAIVVVGLASPSSAGQVRLEIRDGLVTLVAKDASLREILAEWARVGQTRIVNAESVADVPMTVQLTGVPERQALETLLRSAAGFVAAPRAVLQASGSIYDRIMLMPGTRPAVLPTAAASASSNPSQQPAWMRERIVAPPPIVIDDQNDDPLPNAQPPGPTISAGAPQLGMPTAPTAPAPYSGAGMGTPNAPAAQGGPYNNPYGNPYSPNIPANPNAQGPGSAAKPTIPPMPQSASRPGVPTAPIKSPGQAGEIK